MKTKKLDIKIVAKNLTNLLNDYNLSNLSNNDALNLVSKIIGFQDYNNFKNEDKEIIVANIKEKVFACGGKTLDEIKKEQENILKEKFPEIQKKMILLKELNNKVKVYAVDKGPENPSSLTVKMSDSKTNRIFYYPESQTLGFYVYPDVKEARGEFSCEFKLSKNELENKKNILNILKSLSQKRWFDEYFNSDFFDLVEYLEANYEELNRLEF